MSIEVSGQNYSRLPIFRNPGESHAPQPIATETSELLAQPAVPQLRPEMPADMPDYVLGNYDYFYSSKSTDAERNAFIERGITPTNNLRKYFDESQPEYWKPGLRNPLHRNSHQFGHIIERLQTEQPDLWERAVAAEAAYEAARKRHLAAVMDHSGHVYDVPQELSDELDTATWHNRAVMSEVFDAIAPQLQAEGFNPVSACI